MMFLPDDLPEQENPEDSFRDELNNLTERAGRSLLVDTCALLEPLPVKRIAAMSGRRLQERILQERRNKAKANTAERLERHRDSLVFLERRRQHRNHLCKWGYPVVGHAWQEVHTTATINPRCAFSDPFFIGLQHNGRGWVLVSLSAELKDTRTDALAFHGRLGVELFLSDMPEAVRLGVELFLSSVPEAVQLAHPHHIKVEGSLWQFGLEIGFEWFWWRYSQ
jgi:hypothetical protein